MTSPRWQYSSALILLPSQEPWLKNKTLLRESRIWEWLKHLCTIETKRDCIERGREVAIQLTTLPIPQASTTANGAVSPDPPIPPVGKENPGWQLAPSLYWSHFCSRPNSDMAPRGLKVNLQGSTTENLTLKEKWRRAWNNQQMVLADPVHTCSVQVVIPTSSFVHLQDWVRDTLWPRIQQDANLPDSDPKMRSFTSLCPFPGKKLNHRLSHIGCLLVLSDRRASKNSWKLCSSVVL